MAALRPNCHANRHASFNRDSFTLSRKTWISYRHLASAIARVVSANDSYLSLSFCLWVQTALHLTQKTNKLHIFVLVFSFSTPHTPSYLVYMSIFSNSEKACPFISYVRFKNNNRKKDQLLFSQLFRSILKQF